MWDTIRIPARVGTRRFGGMLVKKGWAKRRGSWLVFWVRVVEVGIGPPERQCAGVQYHLGSSSIAVIAQKSRLISRTVRVWAAVMTIVPVIAEIPLVPSAGGRSCPA